MVHVAWATETETETETVSILDDSETRAQRVKATGDTGTYQASPQSLVPTQPAALPTATYD